MQTAGQEPTSADPSYLEARSALVASRAGTWRWDLATGVVDWDPVMEQLCGLEPGTFGRDYDAWLRSLHPDDHGWILDLVDDAVARRSTYDFEHRVVVPDGSIRWLECRGQVTVDESGGPTGTIGCAFDITERKSLERDREALLGYSQQLLDRLNRLQRVGAVLAGAVTLDQVAELVTDELAMPSMGVTRGLWLLEPAGATLRLVASIGFADETAERFSTISLDADLPGAVAARERRIVRSDTPDAAEREFPALHGAARSTEGFLVVPMLVEDACEGVIAVGYDDADLPDVDVQFLVALAGHVGQTIARVRLSEHLTRAGEYQAAIAESERRRRQQVEFIARITESAVAATDPLDLMERVARAAVPRLGDWCTMHFLPEGAAEPTTVVAHRDPDKEAWARQLQERFPFDPDAPAGPAAVIRTGTLEFFESIDEEVVRAVLADRSEAEAAELRELLDQLRITSAVTVPLLTRNGVVGAMQFVVTAESGRRYDRADVALAEAAAGRVADALHAAWIVDQQRQVSVALQEALLPPKLPGIDGIGVASRYWPGGVLTEVGGDFYDLFRADERRWSIAIGDVCGTGADAAAVTAIARHTIRAAARHGTDHLDVIDWVNQALLESDRHRFCTLCYATLERGDHEGTWQLRSVAAGHPLPVIRRVDGTTASLGAPGTLLGAFADTTAAVSDVELRSGDVVVFYTDGMTDLPPPYGADSDDLESVLAGLARPDHPDEVADALHAWLVGRLPDASRHDDVALLVLVVD
jgi:PAS domain S-box-containing protein